MWAPILADPTTITDDFRRPDLHPAAIRFHYWINGRSSFPWSWR